MWTRASRDRMAGFEKRSKRYPTDLTDEGWLFIQPFLRPVAKRGRKLATDLRDVLDALGYLARTGGGWRMLPNDFPPWQTVYWWFRRFVRRLLFRTIHDVTLMLDRSRPVCCRADGDRFVHVPLPERAFCRRLHLLGPSRRTACRRSRHRPLGFASGSQCPSPAQGNDSGLNGRT